MKMPIPPRFNIASFFDHDKAITVKTRSGETITIPPGAIGADTAMDNKKFINCATAYVDTPWGIMQVRQNIWYWEENEKRNYWNEVIIA